MLQKLPSCTHTHTHTHTRPRARYPCLAYHPPPPPPHRDKLTLAVGRADLEYEKLREFERRKKVEAEFFNVRQELAGA